MATNPRQTQISSSITIEEDLVLPSYSDVKTLEGDLNYLRSVIKQMKGTVNYDTPLLETLTSLAQALEDAVFHNATLTGEPEADSPPTGDRSTRIATTEYVRDVLDQELVLSGADARYVHTQNATANVWTITHNLNKFPSVTVATSSGDIVFGMVEYINANEVKVMFSDDPESTYSGGFAGKAYLN